MSVFMDASLASGIYHTLTIILGTKPLEISWRSTEISVIQLSVTSQAFRGHVARAKSLPEWDSNLDQVLKSRINPQIL